MKNIKYIFSIFIIIINISYPQFNNNLLNVGNIKEAKITFSISTNNNMLIVNADIPEGYYAYLKSDIANKILFFADNKEINTKYPEGEKYHNDIIIKGKQEFILNDIDINNISFIKSTYQLCSAKDNVCLQPKSEILYGEEINIPNNSNTIADKKTENASSIENYIKGSNNIFITLILIFAAGLASVLLPCTYPLLSITVSILGTTTDEKNNKKSSVLASLLFAFGVITTYTLLGAVVSVAGFAFHKTILFGSIGYNPIILTILVLLFLYFTFSMAGFYEIKAPSFLQSAKTNAYSKKNQSVFHKYIMGLLAGIVATPCAAPIIAVILEIGFLNPVFATLYMAVYALGFASVLFILGTFASILTKMPKAGTWMVYVKYIFTFLMMIISFYYANILFGVLGFNKRGSKLIKKIKESDNLKMPVISNINREKAKGIEIDIKASDIYNLICGKDLYAFSDYVKMQFFARLFLQPGGKFHAPDIVADIDAVGAGLQNKHFIPLLQSIYFGCAV